MINNYQQYLASMVKIGKDVFVAQNATVLGDITLGDNVSVWYGAIMRADMDKIIVGDRTNIQDGVIFHTDPNMPITVGKENVIGHGAIVHGCTTVSYTHLDVYKRQQHCCAEPYPVLEFGQTCRFACKGDTHHQWGQRTDSTFYP